MSLSPRRVFLLVVVLCLSGPPGASQQEPPEPESPADLGLIEQTGRRLVQVDVTVRGPAGAVAGLTADDFEVTVGGEPIEEFTLDLSCVDHEAISVPTRDPLVPEVTVERARPPGLTLMFFFDQYHLTAGGRIRAFQAARELVERLIAGPNRAMVISSGREVRTLAPLTSDRAALLRAIDEAENDPAQFDAYATTEEHRVQQVYDAFNSGSSEAAIKKRINDVDIRGLEAAREFVADKHSGRGPMPRKLRTTIGGIDSDIALLKNDLDADVHRSGMRQALKIARFLQQEEQLHARLGLARFSMSLAALADEEPPKAVVYFADTVRPNPGEHFLHLFRNIGPESIRTVHWPTMLEAGVPPYREVIDLATAHGIRLYTVQALGLTSELSMIRPPGLNSVAGSANQGAGLSQAPVLSATPAASKVRFDDAENGLAGFALETGGQVFLGAASDPSNVADSILDDLTCVYLISFDPEGLKEDRPLPVRVTVSRPGLDTRHRARLFVDSETVRIASQLSNAFYNAGRTEGVSGMRIVVIPIGFEKGKYQALVQMALPGSALLSSTWDVGLTLTVNGRIREEVSGRVSVDRAGVPIVFESVLEFPPRPYEITGVAHETTTDLVFSNWAAGEWPDPSEGAAVIGPIAVLQPTYGAFVRGDTHRSEGSLGHRPGDWVRPDLPTALVGLVCRDKRSVDLHVDRHVTGATSAEFESVTLDDPDERCGVFVDLIQSGTMTSGRFTYAVRVSEGTALLVERERELVAISPEEIQLAKEVR